HSLENRCLSVPVWPRKTTRGVSTEGERIVMVPEDDNEFESLLRQFQPRRPAVPAGLNASPRLARFPRVAIAVAALVLVAVVLGVVRPAVVRVDLPPVLQSPVRQLIRTNSGARMVPM